MNAVLDAALDYARRGKLIFPCRADKRPFTEHGFKDATSDEQRVREWWHQCPEALIGMPTGSASGLVVIDVDMKESRDGETSLGALERELGPLPATVEALTPSGGRHLYFRAPLDMAISSSAGRLGVGLDVRAEGGYVIVPPSRINGRRYEWEASSEPGQVRVADLPELGCKSSQSCGETTAQGIKMKSHLTASAFTRE
jgi:hypothetical protein